MNKFLLNGEWNVCGVNPFTSQQIEFKGVVPGSTINDIFKSGVEKDDIFQSLHQRLFMWDVSKEIFLSQPVLGSG